MQNPLCIQLISEWTGAKTGWKHLIFSHSNHPVCRGKAEFDLLQMSFPFMWIFLAGWQKGKTLFLLLTHSPVSDLQEASNNSGSLVIHVFSSIQLLIRVWLFATPWIAARQASLSITISWSSLKLTSIESLDAIQPSHPLPSPSPPAPNPSQHQSLFQWVTSCMRWPRYWSFSFSIIPSKEHLGLISFRMDWLDLLAVQGTLKSLRIVPASE